MSNDKIKQMHVRLRYTVFPILFELFLYFNPLIKFHFKKQMRVYAIEFFKFIYIVFKF